MDGSNESFAGPRQRPLPACKLAANLRPDCPVSSDRSRLEQTLASVRASDRNGSNGDRRNRPEAVFGDVPARDCFWLYERSVAGWQT